MQDRDFHLIPFSYIFHRVDVGSSDSYGNNGDDYYYYYYYEEGENEEMYEDGIYDYDYFYIYDGEETFEDENYEEYYDGENYETAYDDSLYEYSYEYADYYSEKYITDTNSTGQQGQRDQPEEEEEYEEEPEEEPEEEEPEEEEAEEEEPEEENPEEEEPEEDYISQTPSAEHESTNVVTGGTTRMPPNSNNSATGNVCQCVTHGYCNSVLNGTVPSNGSSTSGGGMDLRIVNVRTVYLKAASQFILYQIFH